MRELVIKPGESANECAERNGYRCLSRRERLERTEEPDALVVNLTTHETFEAVKK